MGDAVSTRRSGAGNRLVPEAVRDTRARVFLRKTVRFYERLVAHTQRLEARGDDEKALKWIRLTAQIAWAAHPGRLSDERLEAIAIRIGRRLETSPAEHRNEDVPRKRGAARPTGRRLLHVATAVYGIGGHTRLLENWIRTDDGSIHSLLLLDQGAEPIRPWLADRIEASGGDVIAIAQGTTLLERARRLRRVARDGYDAIVLHHHPNDVIPLVAFATADCPPVAVMNHADHAFWLGVSIADVVIEFREFGANLSRERRAVRRSFLFPLPLDIKPSTRTRAQARALLQIPEEELMVLTIGSAAKFVPTQRHRFFETAVKWLDRHPTARLHVVGVSGKESGVLSIPEHDRIVLPGVVVDPTDYQVAADVYLEGFPFGSYTALLETAAKGVAPVVMHSPTEHNEVSLEATLRGLVASAVDEAGYVEEISGLLDDPDARMRRGHMVADRVAAYHGLEASREYLRKFYALLPGLRHEVASLPERSPREDRHDLDLAEFQSSRSAIPTAEWISDKTIADFAVADLVRLLLISVAAKDTGLHMRHAKAWLSMAKRRILQSYRSSS